MIFTSLKQIKMALSKNANATRVIKFKKNRIESNNPRKLSY